MSQLAPNLFTRRYDDLMQIGRSRLPSLAPEWTDHNAHDPGITLMELLAWVAEAQIYSLSRSRRDERNAYAALMGVAPHGGRAARGLIWPDYDDANSLLAGFEQAFAIDLDAAVHVSNSESPGFRAAHRVLWLPARIRSVTTRRSDGTILNHTGANQRGGPAFKPFGDAAGPKDVLRMELAGKTNAPLLPDEAPDEARLTIGVRVDISSSELSSSTPTANSGRTRIEVSLVAGSERLPLKIVEDTTGAFMRTGAFVLDLSGVTIDSNTMTLEFRAPDGFDRAPRVLRIEPNVIPIVQGSRVVRQPYSVDESGPDFGFDLRTPGLEFEPGSDPVKLEVSEASGFAVWKQCERLADHGPLDKVYELDPVAARISFGNGINGKMPAFNAQIAVSYEVSDGVGGNMARNRKWTVHGVTGLFGANPDPIIGGGDPSGWLEQRREARLAKNAHALISNADIEAAARALPALEVGRAWVQPPRTGDLATGTVRLIAMQARRTEGEAAPETPRWLAAIRRALVSRMPLATRLAVAAPTYVGFTIRARVEAEPGRDPVAVKKAVLDELAKRLTLVSAGPGKPERAFGLPVTQRDIAAWIQALPDVKRVPEVQIVLADGGAAGEVKVPPQGLPRVDLKQSTIDVVRSAGGPR